MFGPVYDDQYHVLGACKFLHHHPEYRPLISFISCTGGESLSFNRAFSFLCIIGTAFLIESLVRKSDEKRSYFLVLSIISHPLVLFPFWYAAQLSSAVTMLWASLATSCIIKLTKNRSPLLCCICILVLSIGYFLRLDALVFLLIIVLGIALHQSLSHSFSRKQIQTYLLFPSIVIFLMLAGVFAIKGFIPGYSRLVEFSDLPFYPTDSFLAVECYALLLYLKALVFPLSASFFGPWSQWWEIAQSTTNQNYLSFGMILFMLLAALSILLLKSFNAIRYLVAGIFIFFIAAGVLSVFPRVDWYFLSRSYPGAILAISFFAAALNQTEIKPLLKNTLKVLIISSLSFCSLYSYLQHYSSNESFFRYESDLVGEYSPAIPLILAEEQLRNGEFDLARLSYAKAYHLVPRESLNHSVAAFKYWLQATAGGYHSSKYAGHQLSSLLAAKELLRTDSYIGTSVCLQEDRIDLSECETAKRKKAFCNFYNSPFFAPDFGFKDLRISATDFCKDP
jgi:hypothetical protein